MISDSFGPLHQARHPVTCGHGPRIALAISIRASPVNARLIPKILISHSVHQFNICRTHTHSSLPPFLNHGLLAGRSKMIVKRGHSEHSPTSGQQPDVLQALTRAAAANAAGNTAPVYLWRSAALKRMSVHQRRRPLPDKLHLEQLHGRQSRAETPYGLVRVRQRDKRHGQK